MSTTTTSKPWDLSHVLDFDNAFSLQPASSADGPAAIDAPPTDGHFSDATATRAANSASIGRDAQLNSSTGWAETDGGFGLGDFSNVWQFLGVSASSTNDHALQSGNGPLYNSFPAKADYTSDGASYVFSRAKAACREAEADGTDDGDDTAGSTSDKGLTKTQRKKMRRRQRKEQEKLEQSRYAARSGAMSESEAASSFDSKTPARKASAHLLKDSLHIWNSNTTGLPPKPATGIASTGERGKQKTGKAGRAGKSTGEKSKETYKEVSTSREEISTPRTNRAAEYSVDDISGARADPLRAPATPVVSKTKPSTGGAAKVKNPLNPSSKARSDRFAVSESDATNQAVNAVAAALAKLNQASTPATPTPNSSALRSSKSSPIKQRTNSRMAQTDSIMSMNGGHGVQTPLQQHKSPVPQTQPMPRAYTTIPQIAKGLNLVPATVKPSGKRVSINPGPQPRVGSNESQTANMASTPVKILARPRIPTMPQKKPTIEPKIIRSGEDRHWSLFLNITNAFPEDRKYLVMPMNMTTHNNDPNGIHVFVDASNIFIGFMDALKQSRGINPSEHLPLANLSFDGLALLMERRRPVAKRVFAGSNPRLPSFDKAEAVGYEMNILDKVHKARQLTERQIYFKEQDALRHGRRARAPPVSAVRSNQSAPRFSVLEDVSGSVSGSETNAPQYAPAKMIEQGVDEILHLKICESIIDCNTPSTIVLATGDAAEAEYSRGFMAMVERALRKGWKVELVSWSMAISQAYLKSQWTEAWDGRFRIIYLDDFAEDLLDM